jgi:hypothetical protein
LHSWWNNPALLTWRASFFAPSDEYSSTLVSGLLTTAPLLGFYPSHPFHTPQLKLHYLHRWHQQSRSSRSGTNINMNMKMHMNINTTQTLTLTWAQSWSSIWARVQAWTWTWGQKWTWILYEHKHANMNMNRTWGEQEHECYYLLNHEIKMKTDWICKITWTLTGTCHIVMYTCI